MTRIVIFANGHLNHPDLLKTHLHPTDRIFCADGGTRHALTLGLQPEVIAGDLDSVSPDTVTRLESAGVTVHRYPRNKDQTDLELTLARAVAEQPDEILLVTALGGRLDQMLANILLLTRADYQPIQMALADGPHLARLVRAHQSCTVRGQAGDVVSLVPLSPTVTDVNFSGVNWPLHQATLEFGSTWSISNEISNSEATVSIGQGQLLLIHLSQPAGDASTG